MKAGTVLVVDDDRAMANVCVRVLTDAGFTVLSELSAPRALPLLHRHEFEVIVSDISMPGMDGIEFLRAVRARDLDLPVILMTADPNLKSAIAAIEYGALRYLTKPFELQQLVQAVARAVKLRRLALLKRQALELTGIAGKSIGDKAGLDVRFSAALSALWMEYQPIVSEKQKRVVAYEALVRTGEPTMAKPDDFIRAAERLDRVFDLGRAIRAVVGQDVRELPDDMQLFLNVHPHDLDDPTLLQSPLSSLGPRVVLEITERASLIEQANVVPRVRALRALGHRVAVDDLGAGYAGLSCFAQLEPDVVKLDMTLIRGVDSEPTKQTLVGSMQGVCNELDILLVCEGVETIAERSMLVSLGCDLLQGFHFAKPARGFRPLSAW